MKNSNKIIFLILFSIFYFLFSTPVQAAEIFFGTNSREIGVGSTFEVGVLLKTDSENINALEGGISFSSEFLTLKAIQDGDSIVNLWLLRPQLVKDKDNTKISFAGIMPGGFIGQKGYLFSLIFTANKSGEAEISAVDEKLLLNDGLGTQALASQAPLILKISDSANIQDFIQAKDIELPESFSPFLAKDPAIFDGRWFVAFNTQDKLSGIKYYEVKEEKNRGFLNYFLPEKKWQVAESPYLLADQKLQSQIYIKAIDNAGNQRMEIISPASPLYWYENFIIWLIILLGVMIILAILAFIRKNKKNKNAGGKNKKNK